MSYMSIQNLWSFIKVYAVFVPNLFGEKSVQRKSVWRKKHKYEVYLTPIAIAIPALSLWPRASRKAQLYL